MVRRIWCPPAGNGLVFARTARQVWKIVYFAPDAARGGFFPNGIKFGNDEVTNSAGSFRSERLAI